MNIDNIQTANYRALFDLIWPEDVIHFHNEIAGQFHGFAFELEGNLREIPSHWCDQSAVGFKQIKRCRLWALSRYNGLQVITKLRNHSSAMR